MISEHDPPVYETASFHCHQAVEKILKAFLVLKAVRFEKVHSLSYLLDLCETEDSGFASLRKRLEVLAPFAVEVRYPGGVLEVSREEAQEALAAAEGAWSFVLNLLPDPLRSTFDEGA